MIRKICGAIGVLVGVAILGWMAYNVFVEMQPEAKGRNPLPALLFAAANIYGGIKWLTHKKESKKEGKPVQGAANKLP